MSGISTHILDTADGRPAAGVEVTLERGDGGGWQELRRAATNDDGRVPMLLPAGASLTPGTYRLTFETGRWFERQGVDAFYPVVSVAFTVRDAGQHHHVPLLLAPFGYSTYRGS
ncbi:MAG: hydroxyisourate hydrolase [Thermoanaerobaculia bacterium]